MSAPGSEEPVELSTKAWLRHGPKGLFGPTDAGILFAAGDQLGFLTTRGLAFQVDRADVRVNWPWWEFSGGVHLTVGGKIYRLSLARPPRAADIDESALEALLSASELQEMVTNIRSIFEGRASGKAWKAYFGAKNV
jgi:hypothetical protein